MRKIKVKIKNWVKMKQEFDSIISDGEEIIDCEFHFTKEMENMLPNNRIIEVETFYYDDNDETHKHDEYYYWESNNRGNFNYHISNDMIEEIL